MRISSARWRWLLAVSVLAAVDGGLPAAVHAETRTAAALTPEAVWDAIDAARDGDTVQLPEGTAVWKHGWNTGHWAKMRAITIQGAGIDKTIIRDDTSTAAGDEPFDLKGVEGKPFRITGMTFDGTGLANAGTWAGAIVIGGNCKNFRVDHCKFLNMDRMMTISGDTYGLVDHCDFYALTKKGGLAQTIYYMGPGKANFSKPLTLGTADAVYFEDNEAHFSPEVVNATGNNPWIVPYHGARVVIRHNKIINTQLEIYRVRPGALGCQSAEIYDNAFSAEGAKAGRPQGFIFISGGVAMVFNNTVTGTTYNCRTIEISHERSFQPIGEFGICDGTNPIDGNRIPAGQPGAGYPAMDQPGRATDADGDGVYEPSPCYAWNNTLNGAKLNMVLRRWNPQQTALQAGHVKEGRDFFNAEPKPEVYKPYTYPHPLQAGWDELMKRAAAPASAGPASAPTTAPATQRAGASDGFASARLTGRVTDAAGKPVAGATVLFNRADARRLDFGAAGPQAAAGEDGRYDLPVRFADERIVVREVFAEAKGYARAARELEIPLRGGDTARVDFALQPGAVLAGEVRLPPAPAGRRAGPKPDAAGYVLFVSGPNLDRLSENARTYLTEPGGRFEFYLPPGEYTLRADVAGEPVELQAVKPGRRDLILEPTPFAWNEAEVGKAFDGLWDAMDRHYSYYFLKKEVDWAALKGEYRPRAAATRDAEQLAGVLREMLAHLHDLHVRVETPRGAVPTYRIPWRYNGNLDVTRARLDHVTECGKYAVVGRTKGDGFGYFLMLQQSEATPADAQRAAEAIRGMRDVPGFIVDLRRANGGSEPLAAEIARLFCAKDVVYARSKYRSGPRHDDFGKEMPRVLPATPEAYTRPVVCLIGPGAVSSGEGFTQMMKCLPQVTTVGLPTRGASGNPKPYELGRSGVRVWFSRWVDLMPDGRTFEGLGIPPDVKVDEPPAAYAERDPTLENGLDLLRVKAAEAR